MPKDYSASSAKAGATISEKNKFSGVYELHPCPFCGKSNSVYVESAVYDEGRYLARCRECFASTERYDTPYEAADAWNNDIFSDVTVLTSSDTPYTNDPDIWLDFKNAIVTNAFDQYKIKLRHKYKAQIEAEREEEWFYSKHFKAITDVDGRKVVEAADKQAKYEMYFRDPHNCYKCDTPGCPHLRNIWWLWDRHNEYDKCIGFTKKKPKPLKFGASVKSENLEECV